MRLPMLSRVTSRKMREPLASSVQVHRRFLGLVVEAGLGIGQVVAGQDDLAEDDDRRAVAFVVALAAEGHGAPAQRLHAASALSFTMRTSSVAVRPMMSFALAVSCTPGSWTTTRSAPCCWITGSATPSSFTRLCSVVMFCFSA